MEIEKIQFEIRAVLGQVELPFEAYLELQVGDIVLLDQKVSSPLDVKVGEETLLQGSAGLYETQRAIKVL